MANLSVRKEKNDLNENWPIELFWQQVNTYIIYLIAEPLPSGQVVDRIARRIRQLTVGDFFLWTVTKETRRILEGLRKRTETIGVLSNSESPCKKNITRIQS